MPKARRKSSRPTSSPYARKDEEQNLAEVLSKINQRLENLERKSDMETARKDTEEEDDAEVSFQHIIPENDLVKGDGEDPLLKQHIADISGEVNESTFISGGRKITSLVCAKLKNRIWANEFVSMKDLLKKSDDSANIAIEIDKVSENGTAFKVIQKTQTNSNKELPLNAWVKAFNRFTAIRSIQFPDSSIGMNQHMETVISIAEQNGDWNFYDVEFRHMISKGEARWGSTNLELYLNALMMKNVSKNTNASNFQIPKGACVKFHTTGVCARDKHCQYQHKCTGCLNNHPRFRCTNPAGRPLVLPRFLQPFQGRASRNGGREFQSNTSDKNKTVANTSRSNKS